MQRDFIRTCKNVCVCEKMTVCWPSDQDCWVSSFTSQHWNSPATSWPHTQNKQPFRRFYYILYQTRLQNLRASRSAGKHALQQAICIREQPGWDGSSLLKNFVSWLRLRLLVLAPHKYGGTVGERGSKVKLRLTFKSCLGVKTSKTWDCLSGSTYWTC